MGCGASVLQPGCIPVNRANNGEPAAGAQPPRARNLRGAGRCPARTGAFLGGQAKGKAEEGRLALHPGLLSFKSLPPHGDKRSPTPPFCSFPSRKKSGHYLHLAEMYTPPHQTHPPPHSIPGCRCHAGRYPAKPTSPSLRAGPAGRPQPLPRGCLHPTGLHPLSCGARPLGGAGSPLREVVGLGSPPVWPVRTIIPLRSHRLLPGPLPFPACTTAAPTLSRLYLRGNRKCWRASAKP